DLLYPSVSISLFHTSYGGHRGLRSSPTRRSSDLMRVRVSVPPPGGKGEIKVMDPSFREEAEAAPLTTSAPAMSRDLIERLNIMRSEEHTSELQSRENLVCRLLLEKKKKTQHKQSS